MYYTYIKGHNYIVDEIDTAIILSGFIRQYVNNNESN